MLFTLLLNRIRLFGVLRAFGMLKNDAYTGVEIHILSPGSVNVSIIVAIAGTTPLWNIRAFFIYMPIVATFVPLLDGLFTFVADVGVAENRMI